MCGQDGTLVTVGIAMQFCAWLFYRHPGVEFFIFYVPPWQFARYLKPDGVHLVITGLVAFAVGLILLFAFDY